MTAARIMATTMAALCLADTAAGQSAEQIEAYEQRIEEQARQLDELRRELDALSAVVAEQSQDGEPEAEDAAETPGTPEGRFVFRRNDNLTVSFSGRLHRMLLHVDDGANSDLFYTDSEQGPTMLRFDATGSVNESLSVGATIETGIRQNRPLLISQDQPSSETSVTVRIAEGFVDGSRFGKLSFGRGFASAWLTPEIDLSGTQFASLLSVGMLAPGMKFVDASSNGLSNIQVLTHFADIERLLLIDRFRYDSPSFGPGLQLSTSVANDGRSDFTLRAKPQSSESQNWTVVAGASYQNRPFLDIDRRVDGAVSARHEPTGLNLTIGVTEDRFSGGRDSKTYLVKGGWLADLFDVGRTAFSIDYYVGHDVRLADDEAKSYGLFAVQKLSDIGLDVYLGYRRYDVTRSDIVLRPIDVIALGLAFNF